jgi:hypothetical protein
MEIRVSMNYVVEFICSRVRESLDVGWSGTPRSVGGRDDQVAWYGMLGWRLYVE